MYDYIMCTCYVQPTCVARMLLYYVHLESVYVYTCAYYTVPMYGILVYRRIIIDTDWVLGV